LACGNAAPRALARSLPSLVRLRINSRSNSARPPQHRQPEPPVRGVVSAQLSLNDLNPAPLSATAPSTFSRSRVDRASQSRRVTTSMSPLPNRNDRPRQVLAVGLSAADLLLKDFCASGVLQFRDLRGQRLSVCRYARVAELCHVRTRKGRARPVGVLIVVVGVEVKGASLESARWRFLRNPNEINGPSASPLFCERFRLNARRPPMPLDVGSARAPLSHHDLGRGTHHQRITDLLMTSEPDRRGQLKAR